MQAAVARNVFLFLRQLRVHEIQNQGQRKNRVHARPPKFAGFARGEVREEDARERGKQGDIRLIPELGNLAENAVFEKDQAEHRPAHGDAERLQFVPKQQRDDDRSGPGINMVQVELTPLVGHADQPRERVENHCDDRERKQAHAEAMPGQSEVEIHAHRTHQGDRCESVRLPGQFLQFQPLIRDCQNQRESRPNRSEPAVRVFVPRQKREEPGRRKGVKESYHALVMLGGRGLAREKIQSSGDKRNRQDTQRNGAQNLCAKL